MSMNRFSAGGNLTGSSSLRFLPNAHQMLPKPRKRCKGGKSGWPFE